MPNHFNFDFSFTAGAKTVFVPNEDGLRRGRTILSWFERNVILPDNYFHYLSGGHVTALHRHLHNKWFFRIDLKDFFYSITRNRVARALHAEGFRRARDYAKWSCVNSSYVSAASSRHVLPIGFIQSPALASLVLMRSPVQRVITNAAVDGVYLSVYMDDLIGSSSDLPTLQRVYDDLLRACCEANLPVSAAKLAEPASQIIAFNCHLSQGFTEVTQERVRKFFETPRSVHAEASFRRYRDWVSEANR